MAVIPLGAPLTESATLPVKPLPRVMLTVAVPPAPCTMLAVAEDKLNANEPAAPTVRENGVTLSARPAATPPT